MQHGMKINLHKNMSNCNEKYYSEQTFMPPGSFGCCPLMVMAAKCSERPESSLLPSDTTSPRGLPRGPLSGGRKGLGIS